MVVHVAIGIVERALRIGARYDEALEARAEAHTGSFNLLCCEETVHGQRDAQHDKNRGNDIKHAGFSVIHLSNTPFNLRLKWIFRDSIKLLSKMG